MVSCKRQPAEGNVYSRKNISFNFKKASPEDKQSNNASPELGDYGASVAIIQPDGIETRFYGEHDKNTQYEIGSVTKTMVAYLLADAVTNGKLTLATSVSELWEKGY